MPFKTKRHKISAASRHVINYSNSATLSYSSKNSLKKEAAESSQIILKNVRTIEKDYSFVKSELMKILLLATIIIGLQLALKFSNLPFFR